MVTKEQILEGVLDYADSEVIPHLPTIGKWGIGATLILARNHMEKIIDDALFSPMAQSLGIVDADKNIDIDILVDALKESAERYGKLQYSIPIVGTLCFTAKDIELIKSYIVGDNQNGQKYIYREN